MEARKQNFQLKYLLKRIKIKIKFIMVIVILVLHCMMNVVRSSVSQEYTASSFRVTDLIQVDVEGMVGKKICHIGQVAAVCSGHYN
jgi:uncharacterized membrane protein